jgi:hypothetical protein
MAFVRVLALLRPAAARVGVRARRRACGRLQQPLGLDHHEYATPRCILRCAAAEGECMTLRGGARGALASASIRPGQRITDLRVAP